MCVVDDSKSGSRWIRTKITITKAQNNANAVKCQAKHNISMTQNNITKENLHRKDNWRSISVTRVLLRSVLWESLETIFDVKSSESSKFFLFFPERSFFRAHLQPFQIKTGVCRCSYLLGSVFFKAPLFSVKVKSLILI